MVYITKAIFRRIVNDAPLPERMYFDDTLIWVGPNGLSITLDMPFPFSKMEAIKLLFFKAFCCNFELSVHTFYKKVSSRDSYRFVNPDDKAPCYHCDPNCKAMLSSYRGVRIPEVVYRQGWNKVEEFRRWWQEHSDLRQKDIGAFVFRMNMRFGLELKDKDIESEKYSNSGIKSMDNRSVDKIGEHINQILADFMKKLADNDIINELCIEHPDYLDNETLICYLRNNNNNQDDILYRSVKYILQTKQELHKELELLYQRKYIPDLTFRESLLKSLGFKECSSCYCNLTEEDLEMMNLLSKLNLNEGIMSEEDEELLEKLSCGM